MAGDLYLILHCTVVTVSVPRSALLPPATMAAMPLQVGIISWSGESCGTAADPDVDTKVATYYDWVRQAISEVESSTKSGG